MIDILYKSHKSKVLVDISIFKNYQISITYYLGPKGVCPFCFSEQNSEIYSRALLNNSTGYQIPFSDLFRKEGE
jgi:hypothetical protein